MNDCLELRNIEYQTMLLNSNNNKSYVNISSKKETNNIEKIEEFLEKETLNNKSLNKPWSKLDKLQKINKLYEYAIHLISEEKLTENELIELKKYLKLCLERKRLNRVKDVNYDKEKGIITSLPGLQYKKSTRNFTLKTVDQKKSGTLKNLAPIKNKKKHKLASIGNEKKTAIKIKNQKSKVDKKIEGKK